MVVERLPAAVGLIDPRAIGIAAHLPHSRVGTGVHVVLPVDVGDLLGIRGLMLLPPVCARGIRGILGLGARGQGGLGGIRQCGRGREIPLALVIVVTFGNFFQHGVFLELLLNHTQQLETR